MPRKTKEELWQEFERVSEVFEVIRDFTAIEMGWPEEHMELIPNRDEIRNDILEGKTTLSQSIAGMRDPIMDFRRGLRDYNPERFPYLTPAERGPEAPKFLAFYQQRTGRDFYLDITDPAKTARIVLKRGKIREELEYRVLNEFLVDLSQSDFDSNEIAEIEALCAAFEEAARGAN